MTDFHSRQARNLEAVQSFFNLMHRKDIDSWGELWAENGRILVFYPPAGFGNSIDGKAAIVAAFKGLFGNFRSFESEIAAVYPVADSDAVVVEYKNRAVIVGGTEYTNSNIAVFRFEDGLISAYHDYFDPRRFQVVVDALSKV
ncbi:nuclear transport factor 2 family protein [Mesorhizobium huakuii]|uniref:SnoaL-like domain-containing protein n=1 Tax=Mesorhizobium huakuii TaxID=28104 RepID=A0A7G6T1R1_9HYPH|nr:nuclear transport factor 2 family protein [Mesorhizobium huakuii]QND60693.1 SnoaL-like domain-containing protein [Mesorhizobium huakuii]